MFGMSTRSARHSETRAGALRAAEASFYRGLRNVFGSAQASTLHAEFSENAEADLALRRSHNWIEDCNLAVRLMNDQQTRRGFGLWIVTSFPLIGSRIIIGSAFG